MSPSENTQIIEKIINNQVDVKDFDLSYLIRNCDLTKEISIVERNSVTKSFILYAIFNKKVFFNLSEDDYIFIIENSKINEKVEKQCLNFTPIAWALYLTQEYEKGSKELSDKIINSLIKNADLSVLSENKIPLTQLLFHNKNYNIDGDALNCLLKNSPATFKNTVSDNIPMIWLKSKKTHIKLNSTQWFSLINKYDLNYKNYHKENFLDLYSNSIIHVPNEVIEYLIKNIKEINASAILGLAKKNELSKSYWDILIKKTKIGLNFLLENDLPIREKNFILEEIKDDVLSFKISGLKKILSLGCSFSKNQNLKIINKLSNEDASSFFKDLSYIQKNDIDISYLILKKDISNFDFIGDEIKSVLNLTQDNALSILSNLTEENKKGLFNFFKSKKIEDFENKIKGKIESKFERKINFENVSLNIQRSLLSEKEKTILTNKCYSLTLLNLDNLDDYDNILLKNKFNNIDKEGFENLQKLIDELNVKLESVFKNKIAQEAAVVSFNNLKNSINDVPLNKKMEI